MGALAAPRWLATFAVLIAGTIIALNVKLIVDFVIG
jgi:manganese transport protein